MIIGYARVSTDDQNLDAQTDALAAAGAGKLFADKISGSKRDRPELDRMLDQLRDGDVVTVTKYDRLARSLKEALSEGFFVEPRQGRTFSEHNQVPQSLAGLMFRARAILRSAAPECQSKSPDRMTWSHPRGDVWASSLAS